MKPKTGKKVLQQFLIIGVFSLISYTIQGVNAPKTTIANVVNAVPGTQVTVPVTVSGFTNIGSFTLALDYEYAKLRFVSGKQNASLGGTFDIGDIDKGNGKHRLTVSWFKSGTGVNLPDGSTLVEYTFTFIASPAYLTWFDNGPSSGYSDPSANALTDTPTSEFYVNGVVTDLPSGSIGLNAAKPDNNLSVCAIRNRYLVITGDVKEQTLAKLFDLQGKLLISEKLHSGNYNTVSLSGLKSGIYLLLVWDKNKVQRFKIAVTE